MGEDIHFRMFLKRQKDGKYINAHDVCEWNPEHTSFSEPFSGRNYDIFSLFGSGRGNYEILPSVNYGMPDFLIETDFDEYCKNCGFYGFVWFKIHDLKKDLDEFIEKLKDPLKYYDPDSEEYFEWKELRGSGKKTKEQMIQLHNMYTIWYDTHSTMLNMVYSLHENINYFIVNYCSKQTSDNSFCSVYNKLFNMDETIFLFFFDC